MKFTYDKGALQDICKAPFHFILFPIDQGRIFPPFSYVI
mgnify:CR=1 FL=1